MPRGSIKDYRALYGALALALIGAVLSLQSVLYLHDEYFGREILTARWHWEVVLNIQILCFAFMWFSHHNRILFSRGRWRARAILNFAIGFGAVGMPVFLMLLSATMDWYRNPPGPDAPKYLIGVAAVLWLVSNFLIPGLQKLILVHRKNTRQSREPAGQQMIIAFLLRHSPAALAAVLLLCNDIIGYEIGYIMAPFLCFLHGAIVYYLKAFKVPHYETEVLDGE